MTIRIGDLTPWGLVSGYTRPDDGVSLYNVILSTDAGTVVLSSANLFAGAKKIDIIRPI